MEAVWDRREFEVPGEWAGQRVLLHLGAVDHDATVWVNDLEAVRPRGGSPRSAPTSRPRSAIARVQRRSSSGLGIRFMRCRPGGSSRGSMRTTTVTYTRTTGTWQSVWLEAVPQVHLRPGKITPQVGSAHSPWSYRSPRTGTGWTVSAVLSDERGVIVSASARIDLDRAPVVSLPLPDDRVRLWAPADPHRTTYVPICTMIGAH
jgi:beta-galactosidase/beta-glucuronidase